MPGKVNPVIPEAVNMVCAKVIGNDVSISISGINGNLDLNVMMPIIAHDLLQSVELEANVSRVFAEKCVLGITASPTRCRDLGEKSAAFHGAPPTAEFPAGTGQEYGGEHQGSLHRVPLRAKPGLRVIPCPNASLPLIPVGDGAVDSRTAPARVFKRRA